MLSRYEGEDNKVFIEEHKLCTADGILLVLQRKEGAHVAR